MHAYYHLIPAVQLRFYVKFDASPRQEKVTMREKRRSSVRATRFGDSKLGVAREASVGGSLLGNEK
jgi:hypothetical protein